MTGHALRRLPAARVARRPARRRTSRSRGTRRAPLRELLALPDERLIAALGGARGRRRRGASSSAADAADRARRCAAAAGLAAVCRHDAALSGRACATCRDAPAVLFVAAAADPVGRLVRLAGGPDRDDPPLVRSSARAARRPRASRWRARSAAGSAAAGVTVVSGMALGIDGAAHDGALDGGGATVAVLAGGADVPYPASKRAAVPADRRARAASSPSCRPGHAASAWCFPARNRIIAALGRMTVVVEAARALGLADHRRARRRPRARRRRGARARDVAAGAGHERAARRRRARSSATPHDVLDAAVGVGVDRARARRPGARTLDAAAARAAARASAAGATRSPRWPARRAQARRRSPASTELELLGLARRAPGGRYVRGAAMVTATPGPILRRRVRRNEPHPRRASRSPARTPAAAPASRPT